MANPRKAAVSALVKIEKEGTFSNLAVNEALKVYELEGPDKGLATALIYGVLDRRITLDYILSQFIKTPLKKLKPFTLMTLRTALYQIKYMDKIPESAAVNEAVKLIKASKERCNSGFVNGVLRNILRTEITLPQGNTPKALSVRYSCPLWIVESFIADYGAETAEKLLEESLKAAPMVLRVNTAKISAEGFMELLKSNDIGFKEGSLENTFEILGGLDFKTSEIYKKGYCFAQDYASGRAISRLNPKAGDRVLDICAAPGGKSFTAACFMENKGEILACDLYPHRVRLIESSAKRLGLNIIKTAVADGTVYNPDLGEFDCIICDVPCSGLGVIRRKPEIKYTALEDLENLGEIQFKIIENALKYLKKGGRILYSTCTLRHKENENLVIRLKKEYNNLYTVEEHSFMPHKDGTDGFYCAVLEKR